MRAENRKSKIVNPKWGTWLAVIGLILLTVLPRLTALNQYLIVDEADRWRWAENFVYALSRGDLAATLVGDGYPGIVPVWAESIWVFLEAARRSLVEGRWIGEPGLYLLFHEWDRTPFLTQQRLPVVLLNTVLALAIVAAVWRLFSKRVGLVSGLLIALDPFYLSDSRVNRAEALITGLITLSALSLIFYYRNRKFRYVLISGVFGGLSFLTKIQALALLPAIAVAGFLIYLDAGTSGQDGAGRKQNIPYSLLPASRPYSLRWLIKFGLGWLLAACLTWLLLWPSMWVTPLETLSLVYDYATRKVGAEGVNLFFLGQTYENADPGLLFYPIVFLLRITPLALLGLIAAISRFAWGRKNNAPLPDDPFAAKGSFILVAYVMIYALIMSVGSHKQDRYLMPIFPSLDILAAMGLVSIWVWTQKEIRDWGLEIKKRKADHKSLILKGHDVSNPKSAKGAQSEIQNLKSKIAEPILFVALVAIQLTIVLPHHPYYYSYFNPLVGGGQTAVRTLRVGWGEGMDQVGKYLAAKPNSRNLVVTSRFTHNMLGFEGELITLGPGGRWTQADYVVLYVQQVQRRQDPGPAFIDYFQARRPEKVITLGGIDYAWIYPIPFTTPANPEVSVIPSQAALLGYSWESANGESVRQQNDSGIDDGLPPDPSAPSHLRLLWQNLGLDRNRQLVARLVGPMSQTDWAICSPDPAFVNQAQTSEAFVESLCAPPVSGLPPGVYTVEFGSTPSSSLPVKEGTMTPPLIGGGKGGVEPFLFPEGWQAARVTTGGRVVDTGEVERLELIADSVVPAPAERLDRVYEGQIRLVAYQLDPSWPKPGETLALTLYWQPVREMLAEPVHLIVQLADSRSISLGRVDSVIPNAQGQSDKGWLPGEVVATRHSFELAPDLEAPLAARVEVKLKNKAQVFLRATTLNRELLGAAVARLTVAPESWPALAGTVPVSEMWQDNIALRGYRLFPARVQPGQTLTVKLFWEATGPIAGDYVAFVHLLDEAGQLRTQHDSPPRAGAYPTPWWQPGRVVEDTHPLNLPDNLPGGVYQLVVGLYRSEDGERLALGNGMDIFRLGVVEVR